MKQSLLLLLFFALPFCGKAQTHLQGLVTDEKGHALADVLIMLVKNGGERVFNYASSDANGRYNFQFNSPDDSLQIRVSRLDYASQLLLVDNRSQTLNVQMKQQATVLKEVVVRPTGVWRNRDTLNYSVASYMEQSDRSIADVLKKLPGIEVKSSGQILYNDQPINRFYVEGLDLMGGRYNVISENLHYDKVQSVQILEDHEPIKALEEVSLSDRAALNIVLKEEAKSTWQAAAKLGLGLTPLLWDSELTLLRFSKKSQDAIVYKTNNVGINANRQLNAHYGGISLAQRRLLNIPLPQAGIEEKRSLFNRQHLLTANRLIKLDDVYQLRVNVDYLNDKQTQDHQSRRVYFLDGTEIITDESTHSVWDVNRANVGVNLSGNDKRYFLENAFALHGELGKTRADISGSQQDLKNKVLSIANDFRWLKVIGQWRINVESENKFSSAPQALTIKPGLFADFFNDSLPFEQLQQNAQLQQFFSYSAVSISKSQGRWQMNYDAGLEIDLRELQSHVDVPNKTAPDSLRNTFRYTLARPFVAAKFSYVTGRFNTTLSLPLGLAIQRSNDKISQHVEQENRAYLNPSLNLRYKIAYVWEISANGQYAYRLNTLENLYTGYVLSNYRSISRNTGDFSGTHAQSYHLRFSYNEPLKSIQASISGNYQRSSFDRLPDVDFDGILSVQKLVEGKGFSDSKNLGFTLSKGIGKYITKANLYGSLFFSTAQQQQKGLPMSSENKGYNLTFALQGKILHYANCSYHISYSSTQSKTRGSLQIDRGTLGQLAQNFQVNVFPTKLFTLSLSGNYSKSMADNPLPNTFFMDFQARYKLKRWDLGLQANNIFNAHQYVLASYGDFFSTVSSFALRPFHLMLSVRFSL